MFTQAKLVILAAVGLMLLVGCGPSKAGIQARIDARNRMDVVSANITYEQASQAFESGQFERAMREINFAINRFSEEPRYFVLKGRINLETQRLEQALDSFKKARELDTENAHAQYYSGIVFQRWSDDERAYECYLQASELDTNNVHYLLAAAESLVALGKYESASTLIEPKIKQFEYNAALRHLQAQIAMFQDDSEKATHIYAEARLLDPDDDLLLEEYAWAQFASGRYGECYETVNYILYNSDVPRLDMLRIKARCLSMMGRSTEARDLYIKLCYELPSDSELWVELGTSSWEVGDFQRVAESGTRLIALSPDRYEGYLFRAIHAKQANREADAIKLLREASALAPATAAPHLLLGRMLEEAGISQEALLAYRSALRADPESPEARYLYDQLYQSDRISSVPTNP